jgi:hypothetical protein
MDDTNSVNITYLGEAEAPKYLHQQYPLHELKVHEAMVIDMWDDDLARKLRILANQWSKKNTEGKAKFTIRKYKPFGTTDFKIFIKRLPDEA